MKALKIVLLILLIIFIGQQIDFSFLKIEINPIQLDFSEQPSWAITLIAWVLLIPAIVCPILFGIMSYLKLKEEGHV